MPDCLDRGCNNWLVQAKFLFQALVLFKFRDFTSLNLVGGEQNWVEKDAPLPSLTQLHFYACGALKGI